MPTTHQPNFLSSGKTPEACEVYLLTRRKNLASSGLSSPVKRDVNGPGHELWERL